MPMAPADSASLGVPGAVDIDVGVALPEDSPTEINQDSSIPSVLKKLHKWGEYEAMGQPLASTKFIPMKTPLSLDIISNWTLPDPPKHRLTIADLLAVQHSAGRKVGMILDLSNHECLYSDDIPDTLAYRHVYLGLAAFDAMSTEYGGVTWVQVAKELPSPAFVREVREVAQQFWAEHPGEYIGVHCAYGFNRTGFVVCSYLCEACGYSVEEAVAAFAVSRPPGIRHEHFRAELYARYGSAAPLHPALPPAGPAVSGSSGEQAGSTNGRCSQVPASGAAAVPPPAQSSTTAVAQSVVTRASTVVTACRITTNTSAVAVPDVGQAAEQTVTSPRLSPFSPLAASMLATEDGDVCTPALQHSGGAGAAGPGAPLTPALSENESLGISDRIIMQSFRAHKTVMQAMTPSDIDSLMAAASRMRQQQQHTPDPRLHRTSLGTVAWQAADGLQSEGGSMTIAATDTPESSRRTQLEKHALGLKLT